MEFVVPFVTGIYVAIVLVVFVNRAAAHAEANYRIRGARLRSRMARVNP